MLIYEGTFNSYSDNGDQEAIEYAKGMVWAETETNEQDKPRHSKLIAQLDEVNVHYDFAADYYFFEETKS